MERRWRRSEGIGPIGLKISGRLPNPLGGLSRIVQQKPITFTKLFLLMKHLLFSIFFLLFYNTFCPVFAQKVAEYRWGERRYSRLQWVWEMPGGQLAAIGTHQKSQDTLTEWKLLHLTTNGTVTAEFFLTSDISNVVPISDGATFFCDRYDVQKGRHTRYLMNALTGNVLDSSGFTTSALKSGYGVASHTLADGGRIVMYGTDEGQYGVRLLHFSPSGILLFNKFVSTGALPFVRQSMLLVLPSGRICIYGNSTNGEPEMACFNPEGFLLWKRLVLPSAASFFSVRMVDMGNDRVACSAFKYGSTDSGYAVLFDPSGAVVWERLVWEPGLPKFEITNSFSDKGNLILAGQYYYLQSGEIGMAVVKLAPDGKLLFAQKYPALNGSSMVSGLLSNENYLFSGLQWMPITGGFQASKGYFLSLSPDGNTRWLLGNDSFQVNDVSGFREMKDRGLALVGYGVDGFPNAQSGTQGLVFYLSPTVPTASPATAESRLEAFPNPAMDGAVWLRSKDANQAIQQVQVFAANGRELGRYRPDKAMFQLQLPAERGAYWLKVQTKSGHSEVLKVLRD